MSSAKPTTVVPVIEMTGVSVASSDEPNRPLLEGVNWEVTPGDYWVVGGMHGAGKTGLLSLAAGLTAPLAGRYRLFGQEMPAKGDQFLTERLRIGLVFDNGQLFHQLSIEENIALPLHYHRTLAEGEPVKIVKAMLEWTGVAPFAARLPGSVSRAWQKRAGLARALVLQPDVLLLDNLLSGLDSRNVHWWLDALAELSTGGGLREGRPLTLVAAAEDLRPWRNRAAHFAVLQERRFRPLGHFPTLADLNDPMVRELLAEPLSAA